MRWIRELLAALLRHVRWLDVELTDADRTELAYWDALAAEPPPGRHRAAPAVRRPPPRLRRI